MTRLDLSDDAAALTVALCDIESVSGDERRLAEAIELVLREVPHLTVDRDGNAVVARTDARSRRARRHRRSHRHRAARRQPAVPGRGRPHPRLRHDRHEERRGRRSCGSRRSLAAPNRDVTYVFYDYEEVEADKQRPRPGRPQPPRLAGRRLRGADGADQRHRRGRLPGHACAPTCVLRGHRAHSARSWMGTNAIHAAGDRARSGSRPTRPAEVAIDGLVYREGLNAVGISGGVAGNVIPDECGSPSTTGSRRTKSEEQAADVVRAGVRRLRGRRSPTRLPARCPGCRTRPPRRSSRWSAASRCRSSAGPTCRGSRRSACPAVNYGPGDPSVAHTARGVLRHRADRRVRAEDARLAGS